MEHRGSSIFFTGLPGSGKTTIARVLQQQLEASGYSDIQLLDGDIVRRMWDPPLGFSKADRDLQIQRIAGLARDVAARGGCAICAVIAPYDDARRRARALLETAGAFLLVHVATPLDVCEQRDPKGLYRRARQGEISSLTGISDPYEPPADADVTVDTSRTTAGDAARLIRAQLELLCR